MPDSTIRRVRDDLQAFGAGAPLRAAYELSRRAGLQARIDRAREGKAAPVAEVRAPLVLPPVDDLGPETRERTLGEAAVIAGGTVSLFSQPIAIGTRTNWNAAIHRDASWPDVPWHEIDLHAGDGLDVKWAWELGRHRALVVLARAAQLDPDDDRWLATLTSELMSFLEQCPPGRGVQWWSSLELAIRALAWLEIVGRVGDRFGAALQAEMATHLWHAGRHILTELPYSVSSMRNNHLLGEAVGLVAVGRALGIDRWARVGDRLLRRQLAVEVDADGATLEESLSYQRFVMDLISARVLLGATPGARFDVVPMCRKHLVAAAAFLIRLGALEGVGVVPPFGDWDEGRAIAVTGDPLDFTGAVLLARALGGAPIEIDPRSVPDEVAWFAPRRGGAATAPSADHRGDPIGGGMARVAGRGPGVHHVSAWLRSGRTRGHAHADLCSLSVRVDGSWLVIDPGTGSYNDDAEARQWFRSSRAHAVLELDGEEQVRPHRTFRWGPEPWAAIGDPVEHDEVTVMWGAHAAYAVAVARAVVLAPLGLVVIDAVGGAGRAACLRFPLGPGVRWEPDGGVVRMPDGSELHCHVPMGSTAACVASRWSPTYGAILDADALVISGAVGAGPHVTGFSWSGASPHRVDDGSVVVGHARITIAFDPSGNPSLTVARDDGSVVATRHLQR